MATEYLYWTEDGEHCEMIFSAKYSNHAADMTRSYIRSRVNHGIHVEHYYCYSDAVDQWFVQDTGHVMPCIEERVPKVFRMMRLLHV